MHLSHYVIKKDSLRNGDNQDGTIWNILGTNDSGCVNLETI